MRPHSRLFEFHNKQDEGAERLTRFLAGHLPLKTEIEQYIYLTQLNQGLALKTCLEHWRLNRPKANGSIIWQLNDCWPVTSWSLIDYSGRSKLAYYFVRRAFQPRIVSFIKQADELVLIFSDHSAQPFDGYVDLHELAVESGKILSLERLDIAVKIQEQKPLRSIPYSDRLKSGDRMLIATLYDKSGRQLHRNFFFGSRWKYIRSVGSDIAIEVDPDNDKQLILKSGDALALFASLTHPQLRFDDNAVIMLPDERIMIGVSGEAGSHNQLMECKIFTLNNFLSEV